MPPRTDFLAKQRRQIKARLEELRPAHEEYLTLLDALDALAKVRLPNGRRAGGRTGATKRGPGRPPGSGRKAATGRSGRRRRRRAGGTRAEQALELIKASPGIGVSEIAEKMGIRQNYLYRVTAGLQKDKLVRRRGGGFHPA